MFARKPEVGGSLEWWPDSDGKLTEDLTIRLVVRIVSAVYVLYPCISQVDLTKRGLEQTNANLELELFGTNLILFFMLLCTVNRVTANTLKMNSCLKQSQFYSLGSLNVL